MEEFKRMIIKVSDVEGASATIPSTNDHTDGSWLTTDIYEGELFLNLIDNILQTRTDAGIINLNASSSSDADRVVQDVRYDEAVEKGEPLRITGYNVGSGIITVEKADASASAEMPSYGLAMANYSSGATGQMIAVGTLTDVDTSAFAEGDTVYVAVGGGLTNVKPIEPNLVQNVGFVARSNANNGSIEVVAIGRANDVPNLPLGHTFIGTSTNPTTIDLTTELNDKQDNLISGTNIKTINGNTILGSGNLPIDTTDQWGDITGTLSNQTDLQNELDDKQDNLISGNNIKTINGTTILGSGNLAIDTNDQWGDITGTLSNQTDLQNALDNKQDNLVSGTNIKTVGGTTILGSGNVDLGVTSIVAGTNVTISPAGGTGAVTINASGGGGGGGLTHYQSFDTIGLTTLNTWYVHNTSMNPLYKYPTFQAGTGAEPNFYWNINRFFVNGANSLAGLDFHCSNIQSGGEVEIWVVSYDYDNSRFGATNKQVLVNETFSLTANNQFRKTNFNINPNTFSAETTIQIGFRLIAGTNLFMYTPSLRYHFS